MTDVDVMIKDLIVMLPETKVPVIKTLTNDSGRMLYQEVK